MPATASIAPSTAAPTTASLRILPPGGMSLGAGVALDGGRAGRTGSARGRPNPDVRGNSVAVFPHPRSSNIRPRGPRPVWPVRALAVLSGRARSRQPDRNITHTVLTRRSPNARSRRPGALDPVEQLPVRPQHGLRLRAEAVAGGGVGERAHRVAVLPSVGGKLFARQLPAGPPSIEGMLEHVPAAAGLLELCPEIHGSGSLRSGDG